MNENPYKSPASTTRQRSRFLTLWSNRYFCAAAITAPAILGGLAILFYFSTFAGTLICLALGVWTIAVVGLNAVSRSSPKSTEGS